ncbi:MAG: leucine-rich repeat domain-containing protein [Bacteroidales bacterium]|nr:leucine-rich repeat domain-containing protein [Bacteroidales bacterium]
MHSKVATFTLWLYPNQWKKIENYLFKNCINLTDVIIPDSITSIGECAFKGCKNLTSIVIPDSVKKIGCAAFLGCENLPEETKERVKEINEDAFIDDDCLPF